MKMNQKGFSLIEGLLIVIALSLVGFVGFYVYNANKDDKKSESVAVAPTDEKEPEPEVEDETAAWQEITSANGAFKLKLPDGWKLNNDPTQDFVISSVDSSDLTYKKGQKPVITSKEVPGTDAPLRFSVSVGDAIDDRGNEGTRTEFALAKGEKGTKISSVISDAEFYGVDKFTNLIYQFEKNGKFYRVNYKIFPNEQDNTEIVEKVVRTLQF